MENVILVNELDEPIGEMEKMEAHEKGVLHRAFSVFVFNQKDELLLQKRASSKYHSGGLWSNSCCSHPRTGESVVEAGKRRLLEEMGFSVPLEAVFSFIYKAELDNSLTEHELDHVLIGRFDDLPEINLDEVEDWKYIGLDTLTSDMKSHPESYTEWFKIIFERVRNVLDESISNNSNS
ncbi:MAG: isopentenyl-diphosphate Delta-isomerase [Crocinitomicaceae bacterium]|nr:isopentenyl-diphosphate Delta-isomerase [Flavobacteriales bacterium]NQZ34342.1 isopentenyl-diphosphate Delta-isomerase [Crocinitomicaceae bacterium]